MTLPGHEHLSAIAAAAALRSQPALWHALERALAAGVSQTEIEAAIESAARAAAEAVREDGRRILREVLAYQGARERWAIVNDEE